MNDPNEPPLDLHLELGELTRQTRAWVEWLADSGIDDMPCGPEGAELLERLATAPVVPSATQRPRRQPQRPAPQQAPRAAAQAQRSQQRQPDPQRPDPQTRPAPASPAATPPATVERAPQPGFERPATAEQRQHRLQVLAEEVSACTKCRLHETRTKTAFSRGGCETELVFVGEGPGRQEDEQGIPFVGQAGQLLDKMIVAMGYARDDVYICNIVKCRPPKNRKPEPDEIQACLPYLQEQLAIIAPKAIVTLGATGAQGLLGGRVGVTRMRGRWRVYRGRTPLMPTFHPAYLLRQPEKKRDVWNDLKAVMQRLGKQPPTKSKPKPG